MPDLDTDAVFNPAVPDGRRKSNISCAVDRVAVYNCQLADFKAQERLHRYTDESREGQEEYEGLIGGDMEAFEQTVMQLLNQIDEKKAQNRQRMLQMIGQQKEKLLETERKEIHHD